jgi:hypothetical protein
VQTIAEDEQSGPLSWILFIYTLPSQPSRKRAYVWRELKKLGALYLRDGVAVLPRRADLENRMRSVMDRVVEYDGAADLILSPRFEPRREEELVERFRAERAAEYREVYHACVRFLRDVLEEVDADEFGFPDVDNLESELARLRRWQEQIHERDYFSAPGSVRVQEILAKCETAFERFAATAHDRLEPSARSIREDIFERLGGPDSAAEPLPEDYPL